MFDIWRAVKTAVAAITSFFLGLHVMVQLLVYAILLDIIVGLMVAWMERTISSEISRRGIGRKALMLLVVGGGEIISMHTGIEIMTPWGATWGLGAVLASYYAIQEALSITENLARAGVPLPDELVQRLRRLRRGGYDAQYTKTDR